METRPTNVQSITDEQIRALRADDDHACSICDAYSIVSPGTHQIPVHPTRDGLEATEAWACDACYAEAMGDEDHELQRQRQRFWRCACGSQYGHRGSCQDDDDGEEW